MHCSNVIYHRLDPLLPGTVGAAEERPLCFYAVTHNPASAMIADRGQPVDGTFKAVEGMSISGGDDLKREIVVVPANFASSHWSSWVRVRPVALLAPGEPDPPAWFRGADQWG